MIGTDLGHDTSLGASFVLYVIFGICFVLTIAAAGVILAGTNTDMVRPL